MKKPVDFSTYKMVRNLSFNDFNRWVTEIYKCAYEDGAKDNPIEDECVAALTEDRLMEILLSIRGIGQKRADAVLDSILKEGTSYYGSET